MSAIAGIHRRRTSKVPLAAAEDEPEQYTNQPERAAVEQGLDHR
jgi:hypothetical protein